MDISLEDRTDAVREKIAQTLDRYRQELPVKISRVRESRGHIRAAVHREWEIALTKYDGCAIIAHELGAEVHQRHRDLAFRHDDYIFEVLARLHTQASLLAGEIRALLEAGYANGALARARTMHEIAVLAHFIVEHDQETAERFLVHEATESCRLAEGYEEQALASGASPIEPAKLAQLRAQRDQLETKYGPGFLSDYGWAAEALSPGNRKHKPTFRELEEVVGLSGGRPTYQMTSKQVHVGSLGSTAHIIMVDQQRTFSTMPSLRDLHLPANIALLGLLQATFACLRHGTIAYGDASPATALYALTELIEEANNAFMATELELHERYDQAT